MNQVNWNMLGNFADVGGAVQQGWQHGQQMRRQYDTQSALSAYAQNPDDPQSINKVLAVDPILGMKVQEAHRARTEAAEAKRLEAEKRSRELLVAGAKIVRQINPKDEATWQQARAAAQQAGIPLENVPANFDPNFVQQLISTADALAPERSDDPTALQRNYEFLQSRNPDLAEEYLRNQAAEQPMIASNGDGTFTIIPRSQIGQAPSRQPVPVASQQEYQALPPGTPYIAPDGSHRVKGGATASPSPTFPGP